MSSTDTLHLAIGLLGTSRPFTVVHRSLYRRLGGRGLLRHGLGVDAILLTTRGRRSGRPRTVPLFAFPVAVETDPPGSEAARAVPAAHRGVPEAGRPGRWVVVASNAGSHEAPAWYRNVQADPAVEVQLGESRWLARARAAEGAERDELWRLVVAGYAGYDVYRRRTHRPIPLVVLEPA